jgi:hypothetical protein
VETLRCRLETTLGGPGPNHPAGVADHQVRHLPPRRRPLGLLRIRRLNPMCLLTADLEVINGLLRLRTHRGKHWIKSMRAIVVSNQMLGIHGDVVI